MVTIIGKRDKWGEICCKCEFFKETSEGKDRMGGVCMLDDEIIENWHKSGCQFFIEWQCNNCTDNLHDSECDFDKYSHEISSYEEYLTERATYCESVRQGKCLRKPEHEYTGNKYIFFEYFKDNYLIKNQATGERGRTDFNLDEAKAIVEILNKKGGK